MVSTSGTIGSYSWTNRNVVEAAFRRCGVMPQRIGAEWLEVATDLLYLIQTEYTNVGFPLWTRQYLPLSITAGSPTVNTAAGTMEVLHAYWRIINPYRGNCTLLGGATNTSIFSGTVTTDTSITGPNASVTVNFSSPTEVDCVGVLWGGSTNVTTALKLYTSPDNVTYTLATTLPSTTFVPQVWQYFDLDPCLTAQYLQFVYPVSGAWVINQLQCCLANGQDIELGILNIDDYFNLPNKFFQSDRPNSVFVDRVVNAPVLKIWPTPSLAAFFNGTVTALTRRYMQDPGTLTQIIEAPPRWYNACIARLAVNLLESLPDNPNALTDASGNPTADYLMLQTKQNKFDRLEKAATKAELLAWGEERNRAPVRIFPSIGPYTR
jgi:hypothetical protein